MRATVMFEDGDVRIEDVPDARLVEPTDALVRVTRACICGSDLWPYNQMEHGEAGRRMGHEFVGIVEDVGADIRAAKVFRRRASTAGSLASARTMSTVGRVRRSASRWQTGRWWSCRWVRTTHG